MPGRLRVAILVSGEGTTLEGLVTRWKATDAPIEVALVLADRPGIGALDRARRLALPVELVARRSLAPAEFARVLTDRLRGHGAELVILAGFLSILPPSWVETWKGRALNVHPSLLPRYGGKGMHGAKVHEAVLAAGERETGVTVHLVTGDVDAGPTLEQRRMTVEAQDTPETLRARLAPLELEALDSVVRRFARGDLRLPYR